MQFQRTEISFAQVAFNFALNSQVHKSVIAIYQVRSY